MKTWKLWTLCVFLSAGMSCGNDDDSPVACEADQTRCGTMCCDNATHLCNKGVCQQPTAGAKCVVGQIVCRTDCCDEATQFCSAGLCQQRTHLAP